jgi:hypothetical protein
MKKMSKLRQERHLRDMENLYTQIYIPVVFAVEVEEGRSIFQTSDA